VADSGGDCILHEEEWASYAFEHGTTPHVHILVISHMCGYGIQILTAVYSDVLLVPNVICMKGTLFTEINVKIKCPITNMYVINWTCLGFTIHTIFIHKNLLHVLTLLGHLQGE
jgi:hypothetical protein